MFVAFAPEHETIERETKALKLRLQVRVRSIFRFFVFEKGQAGVLAYPVSPSQTH